MSAEKTKLLNSDEKMMGAPPSYQEPPQADNIRQIVTAGQTHDYLSTIHPGPVIGQIVNTVNGSPLVFNQASAISPCWLCDSTDRPETLFKPCACSGMVHRHCFRKWRTGWINPKNYFSCPRCMHSYNIERIKESTALSEAQIKRGYRIQLLKLWLGLFFFFGMVVFALAGFCYGVDQSKKNIPVACKFLLSSAVNGVPHGNTTKIWEDQFKSPNVAVWPYYTLFSILITSIIILILFSVMGCTFDKKDRSGRTCCDDCCYSCSDSNGTAWCYIGYCDTYDCNCCRSSRHSSSSSCDCGNCNCNGGGCSDCKCNDLKCDGDAAQFLIILLLIIIVAVILSAVFVVIFYALQRTALLYDRYSSMMMSQQEELEGETIVLGMNESWRPLNEV